jgi:hypothetical protein
MASDGQAGQTSPMVYDPLSEGSASTSKTMQFVAAVGGEFPLFKLLLASSSTRTLPKLYFNVLQMHFRNANYVEATLLLLIWQSMKYTAVCTVNFTTYSKCIQCIYVVTCLAFSELFVVSEKVIDCTFRLL